MPYGPNQYLMKKQLGNYTGKVERIDGKCVPHDEHGEWVSINDPSNKLTGNWTNGKFTGSSGGKKKSKKTQRKRKRKHRASSRG